MGTTRYINYLLLISQKKKMVLLEYREYRIRYTLEGNSFVLSVAFLNKSFFGENGHMS